MNKAHQRAEFRNKNAFLRPPPKVSPQLSGVYFVRWETFIKIGSAYNVVSRRRAIEDGIPQGSVVPIAWIPCQKGSHGYQEVKVHDVLAAYRIRGEWFTDCDAVRRFIDRHTMPWPA